MTYSRFKTNPTEGLTVARKISNIRGPKSGAYGSGYEYGVTDQQIIDRGLLIFNYHPDQWGGGGYL